VYQGIYFDTTTYNYIRTAAGEGLTCATFILAVMNSVGIKLLEDETWPVREEDKEWIEQIVGTLAESGVNREHISHQGVPFAGSLSSGGGSWGVH
jgi:hypothetical protein